MAGIAVVPLSVLLLVANLWLVARLTVDTGEETYSVGGFVAIIENIEVARAVVTDIE